MGDNFLLAVAVSSAGAVLIMFCLLLAAGI